MIGAGLKPAVKDHITAGLWLEPTVFWRALISTGLRACSAGLKNTVPADCCERKILFWQDVNSDFVSWLASQPNNALKN